MLQLNSDSSLWSKWYLISDSKNGKAFFTIRRYRKNAGKIQWDRLPKSDYETITNKGELIGYVSRLNTSRNNDVKWALQKFNYDTAFIQNQTVRDFERLLSIETNSKRHVTNLISWLENYFLKFYLFEKKVSDPKFFMQFESEWGEWLLEYKLSASVLRQIRQVSNRFLKFLHRKNSAEIPLIELQPITKAKLKYISKISEKKREKYISQIDFGKIISSCSNELLPYIKLAYSFGVRRSEVLGLDIDDVFESHLAVQRQLLKLLEIPSYGPLKNKECREIPFWFMTPDETYRLIKCKQLMHPDTLSDKFIKLMNVMNLPYKFHDLRRTFITNALRLYHHRDVQLAAGHFYISTTMLYAQDDREHSRKRYKPA